MTAQDLKNSILQLAVQGKLVPQDPSDESAEILLNRIFAEKAKLIQEGKIKKAKLSPDVVDEEKPFDIPDTWKWVRINQISSFVTKGTTPRGGNVTYKSSGIGFLRAENIGRDGKLHLDNLQYIDEATHNGYLQRSVLAKDDLIVTIAGSLGRTSIVSNDVLPLNANQAISFIRWFNTNDIYIPYVQLAIDCPQMQRIMIGKSKATGVPNLTLEIIGNTLIPFPPLAEQKRIVAKIAEILPLIETYGQEEERLKELNAEFPDKLRKSILQQAVQGKLTERDPLDESASELIKRIRAERAVLQKNKVAKKSQAADSIAVNEIPFDIPETWEWVNLGWICQKVGAGSTPKGGSAIYVAEGVKFLREQNVHDDGLRLDGVVYIDEKTNSAKAGSQVQPQDILMNITGASIGRNALVPDDFDTANVNQHVLIIRLVDKELRHYLHYCFSSPAVLNQMFTKQAGDKPGLSATKVENFLVPIPPLEEQKRIVARVEELLAVCDGLK